VRLNDSGKRNRTRDEKIAEIARTRRAAGFHTFRHSAATIVNHTGNLKLVQKLLGHSDLSPTADVYTHTSADAERKCLKRMAPQVGLEPTTLRQNLVRAGMFAPLLGACRSFENLPSARALPLR
jgi:hypothetical protein